MGIYLAVSLISALLWVPILLQFYRSWANRRNPVSMAICAAITLIMWRTLAGIWVITGKLEPNSVILITGVVSGLVAIYAHIAFYWSKRRFNDQRSHKE